MLEFSCELRRGSTISGRVTVVILNRQNPLTSTRYMQSAIDSASSGGSDLGRAKFLGRANPTILTSVHEVRLWHQNLFPSRSFFAKRSFADVLTRCMFFSTRSSAAGTPGRD